MDEWDGIVQSVIVVGGGISQNIFETLSLREPVKKRVENSTLASNFTLGLKFFFKFKKTWSKRA